MRGIPEKLWLQTGGHEDEVSDFNQLHCVTWCEDRQHEDDVEYVLNDYEKKELKHILNQLFEKCAELRELKSEENVTESEWQAVFAEIENLQRKYENIV